MHLTIGKKRLGVRGKVPWALHHRYLGEVGHEAAAHVIGEAKNRHMYLPDASITC